MEHDLDAILPLTFSGIRPGDRAEVLSLIESCGLQTDDLQSSQLRDFLVARKGGRICGVVGLEIIAGSALLRSMAVTAEYRRQGIAARLVEAAERYARSRKVTRLYLLIPEFKAYFSDLGFAAIDSDSPPAALRGTAVFKRLCVEEAVCMVKVLES